MSVLEHCVRRWGEPARTAKYGPAEFEVYVYKWPPEQTRLGVTMYGTAGGSAHVPEHGPSTHRMEFVCGLAPEVDDVALPLALLAAHSFLDGDDLGHSHTVTFEEPLWPGSSFRTFLVLEPLETVVPDLVFPGGNHVLFMRAVPVFASEVEHKNTHGVGGLIDEWRRQGVNFSDPDRRPATGWETSPR